MRFFLFFLWRGMQKFNYRQAGKPRPGLPSGKYPPCSVGNLKTDIPSHTVGEVEELGRKLYTGRYTITHSEGRGAEQNWWTGYAIYPHTQWGKFCNPPMSCLFLDIPSHTVREVQEARSRQHKSRYTLTHSEGRLSVYADFSHLKYLVMQFAQKPFTILVTYLICRKNTLADYFLRIFFLSRRSSILIS